MLRHLKTLTIDQFPRKLPAGDCRVEFDCEDGVRVVRVYVEEPDKVKAVPEGVAVSPDVERYFREPRGR